MSSPATDAPVSAPAPTHQETPSQGIFFQKLSGGFILLCLLAWAVTGIAAIIMSLVCFGLSGSTTEKILGLALAFFLGPLYFIFYAVNKNYCRSMTTNVTSSVNRMMGGAVAAVSSLATATSE